MSTRKTIKSAIESMMFIWGEPLSAKDVADIFNIERKEALEYFRELRDEYEQEGRGIVIREVNKAFQFTTRAENLPYIERLCTPVRRRRLSQSALETLAIVAYRQPVTKGEIESVRGIRCDRVMEGLVKKGLVEEVGRSDTVGRPILYGTTDTFLKQFGFETIKELPDIKDIEGLLDEEDAPEGMDSVVGQISLDELTSASADEQATEPAGDESGDEPSDEPSEAAESANGQSGEQTGDESGDEPSEAAEPTTEEAGDESGDEPVDESVDESGEAAEPAAEESQFE